MKIIYPPNHTQHNPQFEIYNGEKTIHQEKPDRLFNIAKALTRHGLELSEVKSLVPFSLIKRVHDKKYLSFLELSRKIKNNIILYPSIFNHHPPDNISKYKVEVQVGNFSFDMYTPITNSTYNAALESTSCAYEIAQDLARNTLRVGYALCRPPGHHADISQMGGYCYLNNAAISAEYLSGFGKVAILDVDFHHGNGTQSIFYERSDVLTVSIHADPLWRFPYFSGFAYERGKNIGENKNLNYPLPPKTNNLQYQKTLESALIQVAKHKAKYLIVSLGLDTHESDPIGGFSLTTKYYTSMAKTICDLDLPTLIVQEGGYNTTLLGENVYHFLKGFIK